MRRKSNVVAIGPEIDRELCDKLYAFMRMKDLNLNEAITLAIEKIIEEGPIVDPTEGMLDTTEVMEILGCCRRTAINLIEDGRVKGIKTNRKCYAYPESVFEFKEKIMAKNGGRGRGFTKCKQ